MSKLPMWQTDWEQAEQEWNQKAHEAAQKRPLKGLTTLPHMTGITEETAKNLKWKSLKWMILKDHQKEIFKGFFKHPFRYGWEFLKSALRSKPYKREGDFFLYGVDSLDQFEELLKNRDSLLVLGFSYCHKPFECPSGRFTPNCIHDSLNPVCQQCFIGKTVHAAKSKQTIPLLIPTIHYIGGKIFEIVHQNPDKAILFMITACEMTLEMFGDWGNMVNIRGVGIRLDGRICNTMKAFELSEKGIKPGLTVVLDDTQKTILQLIRCRNQAVNHLSNESLL
jgi:hypothetical protein